ncbi:MAG: hypothetical protein WBY44_28070 [Bryobacteraceae bacterium]
MPLLKIPEDIAPAPAGAANSPAPNRLNIVFHGMMAFRDAGSQHYDVLIPFPGKTHHEAVYGNPRSNPQDPFSILKPFPAPPSYWKLEGVDAMGEPCKPAPANTVILKNKMLTLNKVGVRTMIRVPRPDIIRHYRGAEVRGLSLAGDSASAAAMACHPDLMYETTVFSYAHFTHPQLVGPGDPFPVPQFGQYLNLAIYSQPRTKCLEDDRDLFNGMFNCKSNGSKLDVNLFVNNSIADGPPTKTSIGLIEIELMALSEMPGAPQEACPETASPGGCGSGFVDGDGDGSGGNP